MLYAVEYADGEVITSAERTWVQLPKKNIESLIIYDTSEQQHVLAGYDVWFFSDTAVVNAGTSKFEWESRVCGGFSTETGCGTVISVFPKGGYIEMPAKLIDYQSRFSESAFIENDPTR